MIKIATCVQNGRRRRGRFSPGAVLNGKWRIVELIGKGGMAEVYRAQQLNLKRDVAVKIISPDWLDAFQGDAEEIEAARQRFRREVEAAAQVRHANVMQVFDYGLGGAGRDDSPTPAEYIVMEHISGGTLRDTMPENGFYPDEDATRTWLRDYFLPVLEGVRAIHEAGIVHRDLKPENVLLDQDIPKISDFGLARSTQSDGLTGSADVIGTPAYISREQFVDLHGADEASDVYALGKILYEAVSGRLTRDTLFRAVALPEAETPFFEKLSRIIEFATDEERERRLASVVTLKAQLQGLLDLPEPASILGHAASSSNVRRRSFPVLLGVVALTLTSLGLYLAFHGRVDEAAVPSASPAYFDSTPSGDGLPRWRAGGEATGEWISGTMDATTRIPCATAAASPHDAGKGGAGVCR